MSATDLKNDTPVTRGCSRVVRYRLFNKDGIAFGPYPSHKAAADKARELWPGEMQAEDGRPGWDIEVA